MKGRLKDLRIENKRSQKEMASLLGISQGAYSQIERGNSSFSLQHAIIFSREFNVTIDWLATGSGKKKPLNLQEGFIPLVDIEASAGYIKKEGKDAINDLELYRIPGFTSGQYRIFEVEGNSMRPTIMAHDYLICSELKPPYKFLDGTLCTVVTDKEIVVKRIYTDEEDGKIILRSDNPAYSPYVLSLEDIKEMWLVNAKITTTLLSVHHNDQEKRIKMLEKKLASLEERLNNSTK